MPPTVILIRHGEAEHNATQNYELADPGLTLLGKEQCKELEVHLQKHLPIAKDIEAIISSPMIRTVETTLLSLDWLIEGGMKIEMDPLWQENSAKPCDTGSPISALKLLFPSLDFSTVDPIYPAKSSETPYAFSRTKTLGRGVTCLQNLYRRPEKVIAVVSHSGFLRTAVSHVKYANADYRVFCFKDVAAPETVPELVEWKETEGTGGMGKSEPGRAGIRDRDFPTEVQKVKEHLGERSSGEAATEVPA